MNTNEIGINAGRIWNYLDSHDNGESSIKSIQEKLKITEQELCLALGWLARENKIFVYEKNNNNMATLIY